MGTIATSRNGVKQTASRLVTSKLYHRKRKGGVGPSNSYSCGGCRRANFTFWCVCFCKFACCYTTAISDVLQVNMYKLQQT